MFSESPQKGGCNVRLDRMQKRKDFVVTKRVFRQRFNVGETFGASGVVRVSNPIQQIVEIEIQLADMLFALPDIDARRLAKHFEEAIVLGEFPFGRWRRRIVRGIFEVGVLTHGVAENVSK
jgi:hypothetical protein